MLNLKSKNPWLIMIIFFAVLVLLHAVNVLQPLERVFFNAVKPLSGGLYRWGSGISATYEERQETEDLISEIEKLRKEVASLAIDKSHYQEVITENEKLRSQLEFSEYYNYNTVMANVVAKEGIFMTSDRRDLIIDKGSQAGINPEYLVLSEEGVVVGKVVEVEAESSRICLTTSPGCQLAASLQNQDQTQGLTDGRLGLTMEMSYIPQLEKIKRDDIVITSGLSAEIPRGLVIGKVSDVKSESNEVWQSAIIEPIINFNNLTLVSVVIP